LETIYGFFLDESFLIGYLTPEEYFYFIGDLRSKQSGCDFFAKHEEFFNGDSKKKNIYAIYQRKPKKVGIIATLIGNQK
jgi:ABC-2 type transport system ATP-binding protein